MKDKFTAGKRKNHSFVVNKDDIPAFKGEVVHEVCSTFALAREIEWATRLFVIEDKEADEEGVGTRLDIEHKSPAFIGETVEIEAEIVSFDNAELICNYAARVGNRLVAKGITGQKLLKKEKLKEIFSTFRS